ncbi:hypothetical protein [Kitasatospora sp. NPDC058478]
MRETAAYAAKYATKSAESPGGFDRALLCRHRKGHGMAPSA